MGKTGIYFFKYSCLGENCNLYTCIRESKRFKIIGNFVTWCTCRFSSLVLMLESRYFFCFYFVNHIKIKHKKQANSASATLDLIYLDLQRSLDYNNLPISIFLNYKYSKVSKEHKSIYVKKNEPQLPRHHACTARLVQLIILQLCLLLSGQGFYESKK